ncbi:MAG: hypothetical protein R3C40_07455 [Parvularculaceae bacterium]
MKVQGAVNVPLSDPRAVRLAGTTIQRDGYTENVWDGSDIDDRNIYALRGSVRWLPTENTTIDITTSYMRESDSRRPPEKQAWEARFSHCSGATRTARARSTSKIRAPLSRRPRRNPRSAVFGASAAPFGLYSLTTGPGPSVSQPQDSVRSRGTPGRNMTPKNPSS